MMTEIPDLPDAVQPITFGQITGALWAGRATIVRTVVAAVFLCLIWIAVTPRTYQAYAVYAPVSQGGGQGLQDSAMRGLAGLAGGQVGGFERTSPFIKFQALLTSVRVAEIVNAKHPEVLQTLLDDQWDPAEKKWVKPSGVLAPVKGFVKSLLGLPAWQPPSADSLAAYLADNVKVSTDEVTGLTTVTYKNKDPAFAVKLVTYVTQAADDALRRSARVRVNGRIKYLSQVIPQVTMTAQRESLITILSQQQQSSMIVEADPSYAAEPLVAPNVSRKAVWPKPALMLMASLLGGLVVGIVLHLFGPGLIRYMPQKLTRIRVNPFSSRRFDNSAS